MAHVPDQVVVKLRHAFRRDGRVRSRLIQSLPGDVHVVRDFDERGLAVIDLPRGTDIDAVIRQLSRRDEVEFAEPNYIDSAR